MDLVPLAPLDFTSLGIGKSSGERAPGLHASTIYGDFYQDADPKRFKRGGMPPPLLLEMGLAFEKFLEEWLADRLVVSCGPDTSIERPGEFSHKDVYDDIPFTIHYNPDLLIFNGVARVGEIKSTYMSSGVSTAMYERYPLGEAIPEDIEHLRCTVFDPKFDKWWSQIKLYCHMLNMSHARLYAWFVLGGYERPFKPQFLGWDVSFTEDELISEYYMMINHAASKGMLSA